MSLICGVLGLSYGARRSAHKSQVQHPDDLRSFNLYKKGKLNRILVITWNRRLGPLVYPDPGRSSPHTIRIQRYIIELLSRLYH